MIGAEAGGFEPPVRLPVRQFSKLVVSATHPNFLPILRFLADSNRRTRFCRPLTKPLIQGTNISTFSLASFVSRLRLQRYDYFLNLQAFHQKILRKSLFFFIFALLGQWALTASTTACGSIFNTYLLDSLIDTAYKPDKRGYNQYSDNNFLYIHEKNEIFFETPECYFQNA